MAKYLHRSCPKCRDYLCVDVLQRATSDGEHPITGYCAVCGYQLKGWRVIPGGRQSAPSMALKRQTSVGERPLDRSTPSAELF
jgi:hypothetical protein